MVFWKPATQPSAGFQNITAFLVVNDVRFPLHMPFIQRRRALVAIACGTASPAVWAQNFQQDQLETAPNLGALVQVLQARDAVPSTHLLLNAPDIMLAGIANVEMRSELPGTRLLVLARGQFAAATNQPTGLSAPPAIAQRRSLAEVQPAERLPRPVWLANVPFKAGEAASARVQVDIPATQTLTLFAHAQGRWWFVTREIKVGQAPSAQR